MISLSIHRHKRQVSRRHMLRRVRNDSSPQILSLQFPSTYEIPDSPTIAKSPDHPPEPAPENQCDPPKPSPHDYENDDEPPSHLPGLSSASNGRPAARPADWHRSAEQSLPSPTANPSPHAASASLDSYFSFSSFEPTSVKAGDSRPRLSSRTKPGNCGRLR